MGAARRDGSEYDVIVVGSGFAGANLAYDLARAGNSVLVVEAGPGLPKSREDYIENFWLNTFKSPSSPYPPDDNASLSLAGAAAMVNAGRATVQDVVVTTDPAMSRDERNARTYLTYDTDTEPDYMSSPFASTWERVAGGTGNHWMGTCLRMADADFRLHDRHGVGKNWPSAITAAAMAPYYARAEARIGVSADAGEQRDHTDAWFPDDYEYPMPALDKSLVDRALAAAVNGKALTADNTEGARVSGTPAGRNSRPYAGRRACHGNTNCTPLCPIQAKYDPTVTLALALDTGKVRFMEKTVVDRVNIGASGKVSSIHYKQYEDISVPASTGVTNEGTLGTEDTIYVLAANAIENAKLLLMSPWKDRTAANSSGQVGRNLMDHPMFLAWGLGPMDGEPLYGYRGPISTAGIENLRDGAFRSGRAAWRMEIGNEGWNWPTGDPFTSTSDFIDGANASGINPSEERYLGSRLLAKVNAVLTRQFRIGFLVEQLPDPDNRILLSTRYQDNLGIPRPQVRYRLDDYSGKGFESAREAAGTVMDNMGIAAETRFFGVGNEDMQRFTYNGVTYNYQGSGHLCGTHAMGNDAAVSVVDANQKSWDHDNLYLVGCGSHVTVGTQNPTLTLMALAARTADAILARRS